MAKSKQRTLKGKLGGLQRLMSPLAANATELAHLEATRTRFVELMGRAQEAADRQGFHRAAKQEASRQFRAFLTECERLANILRLGVKQHYGIRAEKLAEFDLQPFRGRKAKEDGDEPEPTPPPPVEAEPPAPADPTRE